MQMTIDTQDQAHAAWLMNSLINFLEHHIKNS